MASAPKFEPANLRRRHDGWTAKRQIMFIQALADTACVEQSARSVGMSSSSARKLYRRECAKDFRDAWDAAIDCCTLRVEEAMASRIIKGVARPVFYKGEQVGEWRHHDERLTMFFLRTRRPERYGKWIEAAPAPDPGAVASHPNARLEEHLMGIELSTPHDDGYEVEWPDEEQEEDRGPAGDEGNEDRPGLRAVPQDPPKHGSEQRPGTGPEGPEPRA